MRAKNTQDTNGSRVWDKPPLPPLALWKAESCLCFQQAGPIPVKAPVQARICSSRHTHRLLHVKTRAQAHHKLPHGLLPRSAEPQKLTSEPAHGLYCCSAHAFCCCMRPTQSVSHIKALTQAQQTMPPRAFAKLSMTHCWCHSACALFFPCGHIPQAMKYKRRVTSTVVAQRPWNV